MKRTTDMLLLACLTISMIACGGGQSSTSPPPTASTASQPDQLAAHGGSMFNWAGNDGTLDVLQSYNTNKTAIDAAFRSAYDQGQRRLSFVLYFSDGQSEVLWANDPSGPVSVALVNGKVPQQVLQNVHDVLASLKMMGFEQVLFCFSAKGANNPRDWAAWSESYYAENLSVIEQVRDAVKGSGMPYLLDLDDEGLTNSSGQNNAYDVRLWADYVPLYGTKDTVGMSGDAGAPAYAAMKSIFGSNPPAAIDLHIYDNFTNDQVTAYFQSLQQTFASQGYGNAPWVIGETLYDDATSAAAYHGAILQTNAKVLFLIQWPLIRNNADNPSLYPSPVRFDQYLKEGF